MTVASLASNSPKTIGKTHKTQTTRFTKTNMKHRSNFTLKNKTKIILKHSKHGKLKIDIYLPLSINQHCITN